MSQLKSAFWDGGWSMQNFISVMIYHYFRTYVVLIAQNCDSWQINWSRLASVDLGFIGRAVHKQLEVSQLYQSHSLHPPQKRNSQCRWTVKKTAFPNWSPLTWFWLHPDLCSVCFVFLFSLNDTQFNVHRFQLGGRGCQDQVPEQDGSADHIRRHAGQRLPEEEVIAALPGLLPSKHFTPCGGDQRVGWT